MRNPFTPNHVRLIQDCYPQPSALLASAPEYNPNSQELSRLAYYASNHPAKLAKVGQELEKRAKTEVARARWGNARARASLLVTLGIFKTLGAECRNDISLFTPALISTVAAALTPFTRDLEVAARAASLFTVWTTYTDGHIVGVDPIVTQSYKSVLKLFSSLCEDVAEKGDGETRNRRRLIGIAVLTSVVTSDVLYHATSEFASQVSTIIPGILYTLKEADIDVLKDEAAVVKRQPSASSAFISEFRPRPLAERRAASIHVHIDGERGPSFSDVINASLRALQILLEHATAAQLSDILEAAFVDAENHQWWKNLTFCCWFAQITVDWAQYQYRFAVAKKIVDRLVLIQDAPSPTTMHFAFTSMIHTVLTSSTPLVNLSTSDTISYLLVVLLRRISIDPMDPLLGPLIDCIAALGTHIYYQDQIRELAEDLIGRLVSLQVNGLLGRRNGGSEIGRERGMRCLIAALRGLFRTADRLESRPNSIALGTSVGSDHGEHSGSPGRRNFPTERTPPQRRTRISPEIWQDSLALLCEAEYGVRVDYARILLWFLRVEVFEEPFALRPELTSNGSFPTRRPTAGSVTTDPTTRFLNAVHTAVYTLATSASLGINSSPAASTRSSTHNLPSPPALNIIAATPTIQTPDEKADEPAALELPAEPRVESPTTSNGDGVSQHNRPRRSFNQPRNRKTSLPLSLLDLTSTSGRVPAALPSDYTNLLQILIVLHERLPGRALATGVPMLLALHTFSLQENAKDPYANERRHAIRELLAKLWKAISKVWECEEISSLADKALSELSSVNILESVAPAPNSLLHQPDEPMEWTTVTSCPQSVASPSAPGVINPDLIIQALVSNRNIQVVTGLDRQFLLRRLGAQWTVESALKESVEGPTIQEGFKSNGISPFLKLSPALMHIENLSLQSLVRTQYGVGVNDLREALEGRASVTNLALSTRPSSVRTLDNPSASTSKEPLGLTRSNTHITISKNSSTNDVRDVLKSLGAGKGKRKSSSRLKPSFPGIQSPDARSRTSLAPPYRS